MATVTDREPAEIDPLHQTVDVDALDALFHARANGTPRGPGSITFSIADCEVIVHSEGEIVVTRTGKRETSS